MSTGSSGYSGSGVEGRIVQVRVRVRAAESDVTRIQDAAVELLVSEQPLEPPSVAPILLV